MKRDKLHILYILRSFPTVTEMSTLNEITGMIRRGMNVSIVSLKKPAALSHLHDDVEKYGLLEKVFYLNVATGIRKWKNIILRTLYGQYKLWTGVKIPFRGKWAVALYSMKKRSRQISLTHLVDLVKYITERQPDVLYFHFATHAGELIILRRIFSIPFVVFFHGYDFSKNLDFNALNYTEMFRFGDWFFTNSRFAGKKVESLGCPQEKIDVVGLPVDDHQYPFKARLKENRIRILTVARPVEKKGLEYSIEAVARLAKQFPGVEYDIIGDGPLENKLTKLIESLGAEDSIHLLGSRNKAGVIQHMLSSHIFLIASVTARDGETEGLPMVSLESQLTGLPIVATVHSGLTDSVLDGETGFLVPERDVDALYEKLKWLIEHPHKWEAMGSAGRKHVMKNFREEVYMEKIIGRLELLVE